MDNINSKESPLVSVVSAYYNRQDRVIDSINSLLNQTYKNLEIIVIDDGSTDDTYKFLSSLEDPRLKVISQANQGFVRAIRHAISLSNGDLIAIHGAGDISLPERIEKQVSLLRNRKDVGVVGCYVENINLQNGYSNIHKPKIEGELTQKIIKKYNPFTHGEVMYRKNIYEKVGGYRVFFKYAQDYDLWLRMSLVTNFAVVEEILYKRHQSNGDVSTSIEKTLLQKYFHHVSIQYYKHELNHGINWLDKYGDFAVFFRIRTRKMALTNWKFAVLSMYHNDFERAMFFNNLSINEKALLINQLTMLLILISRKYTFMYKVIKSSILFYYKLPFVKNKNLINIWNNRIDFR